MPLVEQELLTLPEHLSSPPDFSGVRVTRSFVLYVCFVDRCLSFCPYSFGHCVVCSSSIYGFWKPLWYLQTLLTTFPLNACYPKNSNWPILFMWEKDLVWFFKIFFTCVIVINGNICTNLNDKHSLIGQFFILHC